MLENQTTDDELQQVNAVKDIIRALAKTISDARPVMLRQYGLGEKKTNVCLLAALAVTTSFAAKTAYRGSFDDCEELDENLLAMLRETNKQIADLEGT